MFRSSYLGAGRAAARQNNLAGIRRNMAKAMIGRIVKVLVNANTIARGVVTGVSTGDAGTPKLVVGGTRYDLSQILTVTPASLN